MKLYTLTFENNGQTRKEQAAATSLLHALDRLYTFNRITATDKLLDFSMETL
jgi:hypothetical protein